jgi:hypothetical protein
MSLRKLDTAQKVDVRVTYPFNFDAHPKIFSTSAARYDEKNAISAPLTQTSPRASSRLEQPC